jgi:hypothetical protein
MVGACSGVQSTYCERDENEECLWKHSNRYDISCKHTV